MKSRIILLFFLVTTNILLGQELQEVDSLQIPENSVTENVGIWDSSIMNILIPILLLLMLFLYLKMSSKKPRNRSFRK